MTDTELLETNKDITTEEVQRDLLDTLQEIEALERMKPGVEVLNDRVLRMRVESGISKRRDFVRGLQRLLTARNEHGDSQMNRTPEQIAIEHGRYLADAAEQFQQAYNERYRAEDNGDEVDVDAFSDCFRALSSAIYEFRKRAAPGAE